ncbi:MAG: ABC transporter ATP-binding protein [Coriobacteriaceae bacterium]|jgi:ABC-2 type transport system ATP-binding protein|nr:ABC transporter ATP-binding protein [Coriobacteriaceae bacterium]
MSIEIVNYTKSIKGSTVLDNISLRFDPGLIYALRGKNGSGKTMLLRAIAGLVHASSGFVMIDGETIGRDREFPRSIGVLIERPSFIDKYTGLQNLKLLAGIRGKITETDVKAALEAVGLDAADRRTYRKYSLGMKQRLALACSIMEDPDIILLDEPTNALDDEGIELARGILAAKREAQKLIIVASHDAYELDGLIDRTVTLRNGKVVEDFACTDCEPSSATKRGA